MQSICRWMRAGFHRKAPGRTYSRRGKADAGKRCLRCRMGPPVTLMPWPVMLSAKEEERDRGTSASSSSVCGRLGIPEIRSAR